MDLINNQERVNAVVGELRGYLSKAEEQYKAVTEHLETLRNEREEMLRKEKQLNAMQSANARVQQEVEEAQREIEKRDAELSQLKSSLDQRQVSIEKIERKVFEKEKLVDERLADAEKKNVELVDARKSVEKERERLQQAKAQASEILK